MSSYHKLHGERIRQVRTVSNILMRQWARDDIQQLATALRGLLTREGIADLWQRAAAPMTLADVAPDHKTLARFDKTRRRRFAK
jgi:hypothetical protein